MAGTTPARVDDVRSLALFLCTIGTCSALVTSAAAAELPIPSESARPLFYPKPIAQWEVEVGGRYWFSDGRTRIGVFGLTGISDNIFLSQLTWSGLRAQSPEVFVRADHLSGFFVKGFLGGASISGGNLQDEDFPPVIVPYSSTNSAQGDGNLRYAAIDAGWGWRSQEYRFGFFGGFHYYREHVNGFGCVQTAFNPFICVPSIPSSVLAITQDTGWNALRLGFDAEWRFAGGWIASADVAWVPYAWLVATDNHWLRPFTGAETGSSFGDWEVEALLRYQFANGISIGGGARYWRINTAFAQSNRNDIGLPQTISLFTERFGGFVQVSYKFGELRTLRY